MKAKALFIILFFSFFFTTVATAQVNRSIGRDQYKRPKSKFEKKDFVIVSSEYYAKELGLDDFQAAAVREIIERERDAIMTLGEDRNASEMEKKERGRVISERIEKKMVPLLSKEQLEKFKSMEDKRKKS